jgi:calcium/calmodulin-dependent protein kinase I
MIATSNLLCFRSLPQESHSSVVASRGDADTFFPPIDSNSSNPFIVPSAGYTSIAKKIDNEVNKPHVEHPITTSSPAPEKRKDRQQEPVAPGTSGSPVKKKTSYVPPAPIAPAAVKTSTPSPSSPVKQPIVKSRPPPPPPPDHSVSVSTLDTKSASKALKKQKQPDYLNDSANGSSLASTLDYNRSLASSFQNGEDDTVGDESFQPDDIFRGSASALDDSSAYGESEDFHGLLDLHQSGFDQTAISVITSMTTEVTVKDAVSVESQHEYPTTSPEPNSSSGMRFDELYRLKGVLGTGAFSTVREGFHRSNANMSYAVKCINRKKLSEEDEAALLDEVSILKELKHAHIIRLFDFFEEPSTYYLVMERMRGGELFDRIVAKAYYNEKEARDTCKIVLEAVCFCHDNHVAHRDLKPENLLLLSDMDDSAVKIADFGFAKKVYEPNSLTTQCGTPGYVAPEILEGTAYDERADMWSVGVILYILLGGYPPFIESTQRDLFRKIRKGDYEFHEEYWGTVSSEAKELISSLLTVSCTDRLTAQQALQNSWILGDDAKLASKDLGGNLTKLRNFNAKRKFRAAVSTVIAVNKLNFMGKEFFSDTGVKNHDNGDES